MTRTIDTADEAFSFTLPDERHERIWWIRDQMHHPRPTTPYTASIEPETFSAGATRGYRSLGVPISMRTLVLNGYWYLGIELDNYDIEAWMPDARAQLMAILPGLVERWRTEYLPRVMELNARLRDFDYAAASTDDLVAHLRWSIEQRHEQWEIHMRAVAPLFIAAGQLEQMWGETFGEDRKAEALTIMGGFPNKTVESGIALWKLSRELRDMPDVARIVAETAPKRTMPLLRAMEAARPFVARLDAYLDDYGWRAGAFEFEEACWREEPSVVIAALRDFLEQPDDADPAATSAKAAAERDELLARVGPEIEALPQGPILRMVIGVAQQYLPMQEDHNFYIDQMNTVLMRLPALEAGRRLVAADALAVPDDIFYLTADEVFQALADPGAGDWAEIVAERRDLRVRQAAIAPPATLGTPLPDDLAQESPLARFFGEPIEQDESSNVLRGNAASHGVVTGRACVIRTLDEADRLKPGEILVCEMTMPAWTPLFAVAAGVVTDSGGTLSHSAIVAREYRIPAVVGTTSGTRRIKDGDTITVDGSEGTVTIHGASS